ncbi:GGDEF domain-containing protein [Bacillus sp. 2205SS5-2]|uniref:GGDEF domain-containing protein n=1 Tax=Bacillus sp. 2205SS5-2 TaxID=3109031 RepID=UPI003007A5E4
MNAMNWHGRIWVIGSITGFGSLFIIIRYLTYKNIYFSGIADYFLLAMFFLLCTLGFLLGYYFDKYRYVAHMDVLTNLRNRYFLTKAFERRKKSQISFFLQFIDLDDFKRVNDVYGHQVGDEALISIASTLRKYFQKGDVVCRWGGDEFVVLTSEKQPNLQKAITNELKTLLPNETISLSIGIVSYPADGESLQELVRTADKKMYTNKIDKKRYAACE